MDTEYRLTPGMASRRLQVVSYVLQYIRRWGESPSYGEISGALGIKKWTARDCLKRAIARGELVRVPGDGRRALRPPANARAIPPRLDADLAAQLVAQLRAEGYIVDGTTTVAETRTSFTLPGARELDHIPCHDEAEVPRRAA